MRMTGRSGVAAGLTAMLAACASPTGEEMELERARALWNSRKIDDYQMTVRLNGAWLGGAAVIQVRNGTPVSVRPLGEQVLPGDVFNGYDTVEELFAGLQHAVDNDADRIDAKFHARYGVPLDVYIDVRTTWADDEHGFDVESFQRQ